MANYSHKQLHEIEYYIEIDRFEHAINKIKELLALEPNNGRLLYLLAYCNHNIDNNIEALEHCYNAIENDYSVEVCQALIGHINVDMEKYIEAEEAFINVLSINPESAEVLAAYGNLLAITGYGKKGNLLIKEALRLEPENIAVLHYQSLFFMNSEKKENSEITSILENIVANSDDQVTTLTHLGAHNYYRNKFKLAKEHLTQAYSLDPTNESLLKFLKLVRYDSNIFFRPLLLANKIGGPIGMLVLFIILTGLSTYLENNALSTITLSAFAVFVIYSRVAESIRDRFLKRNGYEIG